VSNCFLVNGAGTYGFVNGQLCGGLAFRGNFIQSPSTFFDAGPEGTQFFNTLSSTQTLVFESDGSAAAGVGYNCQPQIQGHEIFGQFALRSLSRNAGGATVATNNDYANPGTAALEISNVGLNFVITGIAGGTDGQLMELVNLTQLDGGGPYQMTIAHQNTGSAAANRIIVPTGANYVNTPGAGGVDIVRLRYSGSQSRWLMY